ncbi:MAG: hypothetical protein ACREV6_20495 [Clostridium sp.]|uniref:hypothetical protein n=1 Tax=Clostridium sp. TaxID=1506 RepID=UPI003D6D9ECB
MNGWNYEEYLNSQIKKIEELKIKGYTEREILDRNEFCFEALKYCNLPISYLVPKSEGQELDLRMWDTHTSCEHKWQYYDGVPFGNPDERDRVLMGLLYSMGFKHLLEILSQESKEELFKLVCCCKNKS